MKKFELSGFNNLNVETENDTTITGDFGVTIVRHNDGKYSLSVLEEGSSIGKDVLLPLLKKAMVMGDMKTDQEIYDSYLELGLTSVVIKDVDSITTVEQIVDFENNYILKPKSILIHNPLDVVLGEIPIDVTLDFEVDLDTKNINIATKSLDFTFIDIPEKEINAFLENVDYISEHEIPNVVKKHSDDIGNILNNLIVIYLQKAE